MKLILINAPPYAGKDTAAAAIQRSYGGQLPIILERMSMPLKRAFAGLMNLECDPLGRVEPWERRKEAIIPQLGVSYRQWQISFSEDFIKPVSGEDCFARLLLNRIVGFSNTGTVFVIPDCGFQIEIDTLIREIPHQNILLIKIDRPGAEWDSRELVVVPDSIATLRAFNSQSLVEFEDLISFLTKNWINQ